MKRASSDAQPAPLPRLASANRGARARQGVLATDSRSRSQPSRGCDAEPISGERRPGDRTRRRARAARFSLCSCNMRAHARMLHEARVVRCATSCPSSTCVRPTGELSHDRVSSRRIRVRGRSRREAAMLNPSRASDGQEIGREDERGPRDSACVHATCGLARLEQDATASEPTPAADYSSSRTPKRSASPTPTITRSQVSESTS